MEGNLLQLLDVGLFFGLIVAVCVWQLISTSRAKKRRLERELAQGLSEDGPPVAPFVRRAPVAATAPARVAAGSRAAEPRSAIEKPHAAGLLDSAAFAQVVVASGRRMIFTSGQVSIDDEGGLIGGDDLAAQATQAMRNLGLALAGVGAGFADVVKTTTYVVNYRPEQRFVIAKAKAPFFSGMKPPASALVGVAALASPDWLIEIEAVAIVD
jgi:enamine deaminase RidA (YjgF/YER057c/UK114 family)